MQRVTIGPFGQIVAVPCASFPGEELVVIKRPQALAIAPCGHLHPCDRGAFGSEGRRQSIDIRDDVEGRLHVGDIKLLHVDDDERRFEGFKPIEDTQATPFIHNAPNDVGGHFKPRLGIS